MPRRMLIAAALVIALGVSLWCIGAGTGGIYRDASTPDGVAQAKHGYGPTVVIADPPDGAHVDSSTSQITGSIAAISVTSVEISIRKRIANDPPIGYWNGAGWQNPQAWLPCTLSGISPNFTFSYVSAGLFETGHNYTVTVRYTDAGGYVETSNPVTYYS